jgi:hypothetical protein
VHNFVLHDTGRDNLCKLQITTVLSFLFFLYRTITTVAASTAITGTSSIFSTISGSFVSEALVPGTTKHFSLCVGRSFQEFYDFLFFANMMNIYISEETPNLFFAISPRVKYFNIP